MLRLIVYESKENTQDRCWLPCRSDCLFRSPSGTSQLTGTLVLNIALLLTRTSV